MGFSGFEAKDTGVDPVDGGRFGTGATVETTIVHSGAASLKCDSGAGNVASRGSLAGSSLTVPTTTATYNWFGRAYFYFVDWPGSTVSILRVGNWAGFSDAHQDVSMDSGGHLLADTESSGASSPSAEPVSKSVWHMIEVSVTWVVTSGVGRHCTVNDIRLDGASLGLTSGPGTDLAISSPNTMTLFAGWVEAPGANKVVYIDDIGWNDDSAGSQTSWLGHGSTALLVPISDNARAALWTGGTGGTTNLFDAVDNKPPVGTATETNTTQIEHAGSAAGSTDAYDANLTSYSTAGIGPSDSINVVSMIASDGEDSATGTKLLAYSMQSNPAIATPGNVTAGADAGALATYPTTWTQRRMHGTTYGPAVTVGTSPVMRVTRPETAARVASVCFMGLSVDYTPRRAPPFSRRHRNYIIR